MSITVTSFSPNTLIQSAAVNANFSNIVTAVPWDSNPIAAKGDLVVGHAASVAQTLTVGTNGQVLTADSSTPTGTKWADAASAPTSPGSLSNVGLQTTVGAGALTINLTQSDGVTTPTGGSPVIISIRSATSATGGYSALTVSSATTLTVPSSATLGTVNSTAAYLWIYAINNAGTLELAISGVRYDEGSIVSTTTISSGATSRATIYSTTGRSNVGIRLLGRIRVSETSAGTWASAPSEVSLAPAIEAEETVFASYTLSGTPSMTQNTDNVVVWDTVVEDTHNAMNTGSGVYTVKKAGLYAVTAHAAAAIATLSSLFTKVKNGSTVTSTIRTLNMAADSRIAQANHSFTLRCAAGDTISFTVNPDGGAYNLLNDASNSLPTITIQWVGK